MSLETPKKSVQEELAEMETKKKETELSLEEINKKIEELKSQLETTVETATVIPEHQKNQILDQGGNLEEVSERTKGVDQQIEEVKESVSEQNVEKKEIELSPEQKYDKKASEFNGIVDKLVAFDKQLDKKYEECVKESGFESADELEKAFEVSGEKVLQVERGEVSAIVLNDTEKKLYNFRKSYLAESVVIEPQQKELEVKLKAIASEGNDSFRASEKMMLDQKSFQNYEASLFKEYGQKIVDFYSKIDPENKMGFGQDTPKGKVRNLWEEVRNILSQSKNKGFKVINEKYNHRLTSEEYEKALQDSVQKIGDIQKQIENVMSQS